MGRSSACLDNMQHEGGKVYFDRIKKQLLDKVLVSTQLLVHQIGMQHTHGIHLSKDMVSGPCGAPHVYAYFKATETLVLCLAAMFHVAFPEFYEKYRKAFEAGKWTVVDFGPFLGRVIVWKLSVLAYQDGLDEGPALSRYRLGKVIILMSGVLYHGIGQWTPQPGVSEDGIMPGRIHVFGLHYLMRGLLPSIEQSRGISG
ncbi:hypothetical protein BDR03DRAFT_987711 [Suillus americanus]|nr:hypothetical protein BDR03DRAFT_987711 [Suillus americanus]